MNSLPDKCFFQAACSQAWELSAGLLWCALCSILSTTCGRLPHTIIRGGGLRCCCLGLQVALPGGFTAQ